MPSSPNPFYSMKISISVLLLLLAAGLTSCREKPVAVASSEEADVPGYRVHRSSVVEYRRGRGFSAASSNVRSNATFAPTTSEETRAAHALAGRLNAATTRKEVADVFAEARALQSDALLNVVKAAMQKADEDTKVEALTMIDGVDSPAITPLLASALRDPSLEVRLQAMEAAQKLQGEGVKDLALTAMQDEDLNVRQLGFDTGTKQDPETREEIIRTAALSPNEDLALASMALLEASPSKNTIATVIGALGHTKPKVREQAHEMLFLLLKQDFKSTSAAKTWWQQYQGAFDDNLVAVNYEALGAK